MNALQPATAAVIYQKLDGQSATVAGSPSTIPALDDPEMLEQVVEVANENQE
jgi:hypothetical protein